MTTRIVDALAHKVHTTLYSQFQHRHLQAVSNALSCTIKNLQQYVRAYPSALWLACVFLRWCDEDCWAGGQGGCTKDYIKRLPRGSNFTFGAAHIKVGVTSAIAYEG